MHSWLKEMFQRYLCSDSSEDLTGSRESGKAGLSHNPRTMAMLVGLTFVTMPMSAGSAAAGCSRVPVRITEIMYHPVGGDAYEFVELQNTGDLAVDLSGMFFDGISFTFAANSVLAPKAILVLNSDSNPAAFKARYPAVVVAGTYGGRLANGGERIALQTSASETVTSVTYGDSGF